MARTLSEEFERELLQVTGRLFAAGPEPVRSIPSQINTRRRHAEIIDLPSKHSHVSITKPVKPKTEKVKRAQELQMMETMIQDLQGTIDRLEREIVVKKRVDKSEIDTRPMTVEEKKALSIQINQLNGHEIEGLLGIMHDNIPDDQNHQEDIEIDMDTMPNEVLRQMEKYIRKCQEVKIGSRKQRKHYTHITKREDIMDYDDKHFVEDFENSGL